MSTHFERVKSYIYELGFSPIRENEAEELVVIEDEDRGIKNLIVDCEDPILILEQYIFSISSSAPTDVYKRLLQMNRTLVHGAFVLDEEGKKVMFRDTLQLENLDLNELEATIHALSVAMAENLEEIIKFAQA